MIQRVLSADRPIELEGDAAPIARQVIDLDAMRQAGLTITMQDISPLEARGLVILAEERDRIRAHEAAAEDMRARGAQMRASGKGF